MNRVTRCRNGCPLVLGTRWWRQKGWNEQGDILQKRLPAGPRYSMVVAQLFLTRMSFSRTQKHLQQTENWLFVNFYLVMTLILSNLDLDVHFKVNIRWNMIFTHLTLDSITLILKLKPRYDQDVSVHPSWSSYLQQFKRYSMKRHTDTRTRLKLLLTSSSVTIYLSNESNYRIEQSERHTWDTLPDQNKMFHKQIT